MRRVRGRGVSDSEREGAVVACCAMYEEGDMQGRPSDVDQRVRGQVQRRVLHSRVTVVFQGPLVVAGTNAELVLQGFSTRTQW